MARPLRVLYAEDNPLDADLTCSHFAQVAPEIAIDVVETGTLCLEHLTASAHDLLLLDHHLPDMEGLDVLRALMRARQQLPVVLVTGVGDENLVVKALRLGASTYVPKDGGYLKGLPELLRRVVDDFEERRRQGLLAESSRRILYIEHNPMDVELTLQHFAEAAPGYEIEVLRSCAEALARLGRPPAYDAALIDLRMPDQSGLDFAREAQLLGLPLPPFVVISGRGDEAAAIASLKLGAADYVTKNEGYLDRLQYAVDRAIAHRRLAQMTEQLRAELAERERVEVALRESEQRFRDTFERSTIGKAITSGDGRLARVNQAFASMLGYSIEELQARSLSDVTFPEDLPATMEVVRCLLSGESISRRVEKRYVHRDGHLVFADVSTTVLVTSPSQPAHMITSIVDISARKQVEKEREELEQQLRLSQRMEAIGRLAGGVAHDFNNLLTVILSGTDFALERAKHDPEMSNELRQIRSAGERAALLTRQLLAFGRKQALTPVVLNLNHVVSSVDGILERILGEDIDYVRVLAPDLGAVSADQSQIEQVVMNLVVNARDAMGEGGTLTVETANVELDDGYAAKHLAVKPGPYVLLSVTDTGSGMDHQTQARIFEPFFTTKGPGKGTGLGLSTVYGIVKQSGGNVWVYSEPGRGSTFKVYLPRVRPATSTATAAKAPPVRTTGSETILVVEDEDAIREIARRILVAAGYTVLTARNGKEALSLCEAHPETIHLVLTDVVMPEMGGVMLAQRLISARPGIKIVYMSGYSDDAAAHSGRPGSASSHFVAKPFSDQDLTRGIRAILDGD